MPESEHYPTSMPRTPSKWAFDNFVTQHLELNAPIHQICPRKCIGLASNPTLEHGKLSILAEVECEKSS